MTCTRYAGDLADAVAGEASTPVLQAHLQGCDACRKSLDEGRQVLAALDRDLGEALALEPSAALLARVQASVAEVESAPVDPSSGSPTAWRIAATVAVAAGVAGSLWLLRPAAPRGKTPLRIASAAPSTPVVSPRQPAGMGAAPTIAVASGVPAKSPTPVRRVSIQPSEPEVIVPPGEAALLARFVMILRTRTVEPSSLLVARSDEGLPELKAIDVSPLVIRPLSEDLEPADDGRME